MKTFSKILSMILVVVMCFGLFATSAFAEIIIVDDGEQLDSAMDAIAVSDSDTIIVSSVDDDDDIPDTIIADEPIVPTVPTVDDADDDTDTITVGTSGATIVVDDEDEDTDDGIVIGDALILGGTVLNAPGAPVSFNLLDPKDVKLTGKTGSPGPYVSFCYTTLGTLTPGDAKAIDGIDDGTNTTIFKAGMMNFKEGQNYYIWGTTSGTGGKTECIGIVQVAELGSYTVTPGTFYKYDDTQKDIKVTSTAGNLLLYAGFCLVPSGSNKGTEIEKVKSVTASTLTIDKSEFSTLTDGTYFIYGFNKDQTVMRKLGKVVVKTKEDGGHNSDDPSQPWTLWPTIQPNAWIGGDDPMLFRSDLMALRGKPGHNIIVRYGQGSSADKLVGVNQYWDMGDGVFALGVNLLSSLPTGSYVLQVIDLKGLEDCTNLAHFRIGPALRAIDTDKHVIGSIKNLRFLCDDPISQVLVGGIPLTLGEDYGLSNGGKTVTLSFEFLNKRTPGKTYTITVVTAYGDSPSANFQILSTAQGSASPRTGDESNLGLWAAFLLLSGAAVVVLVPKIRKHEI